MPKLPRMGLEAVDLSRASAPPWNRNPLNFVRDLIAKDPKLSPRARSHATLKLEDLKAMCTDDPRQQIVVAGAMESYATWVGLAEQSARATRDTAKADVQEQRKARALNNCAKWLRLAGLANKAKKQGKAGMFTAPRTPTPTHKRSDCAQPLVTDDDTNHAT